MAPLDCAARVTFLEDLVRCGRVEWLRFAPRTGWSMCHLDRRLISIKRVDDAESSISTVTG